MKAPTTYQDYLNFLAAQPQAISEAFAHYLEEANMLLPFSESSSTSLFLVNYLTKQYHFISPNTLQVMGHVCEAFLEGGLPFMLHHQHDFLLMSQRMFPDEIHFLAEHPTLNRMHLRFSKSYRFRSQTGELRTILQRSTIVETNHQSTPIAMFGFAWDISNWVELGKLTHQIETFDANKQMWQLSFSKEYYPDVSPEQLLSKREIEILKWAIEGYGSKQIADKLHISFNTVNTHRRNMLRKTNCQNLLELLSFALKQRLL